jgi:hypothetical protein
MLTKVVTCDPLYPCSPLQWLAWVQLIHTLAAGKLAASTVCLAPAFGGSAAAAPLRRAAAVLWQLARCSPLSFPQQPGEHCCRPASGVMPAQHPLSCWVTADPLVHTDRLPGSPTPVTLDRPQTCKQHGLMPWVQPGARPAAPQAPPSACAAAWRFGCWRAGGMRCRWRASM